MNINFELPQSWNELERETAMKCYHLIMAELGGLFSAQESVPAKRILLFQILSGITEQQLTEWKNDRLAEFPEDGETVFLAELESALESCNFLFDIREAEESEDGITTYAIHLGLTQCPWPELVRSKKNGKKKVLHAPADELDNITFYELCMTFSLFEQYLDSEDESFIDELLAVLYRPHKPRTKENKRMAYQGDIRQPLLHHEALIPKRKKRMATLPKPCKQLLTFWFASCRQHIINSYPDLFTEPKDGGSKNEHGWGGVLMALAGELNHLDEVSSQPAHTALLFMDYLSSQQKQRMERARQMHNAG